jgi:hypothetical protein
MDWPSLRQDLSAVDPRAAAEAHNVSFGVDGELRLRAGLGEKIAEGGVLSTEFQHPTTGNHAIFLTAAGTLRGVSLTTGTATTLASDLRTGSTGCFARSNGRLYLANDFNAMRVVERGDTTALTAGIVAPAGAIGAPSEAAGAVKVGSHLVRYRYLNSKSGYISDPSDALEHVVSTTPKALTFSISDAGDGGAIIRSTDAKVDQIIVEMSPAGGLTYYRAARVNQTASTVTVDLNDDSLVMQDQSANYGDFGHQPPPLFSLVIEHRGRLFGWGSDAVTGLEATVADTSAAVTGVGFSTEWAGRLITFGAETRQYRILSVASSTALTLSEPYSGALTATTAAVFSPAPDMLYWSRAGYPESWKPTEWARRVLQNQSDLPAGMASFYGDLYLFGQRSMRVMTFTSDPAAGRLETVPGSIGLWNQQCLVEAEGKLYGWGRGGPFVVAGLQPRYIGGPVEETVRTAVDASKLRQFHGTYDPNERSITWFYVAQGDTAPRSGLCMEIDTGKWSTRAWRQAIVASTLIAQGEQSIQALLSDGDGVSWYQTEGRYDGLPSSLAGGVCVCESGATTTEIPVSSPSLPSGDLVGAMLYQPSSGEARRITANTAGAITVADPFTTAPALYEEVYIGSIAWAWRTPWMQSAQGQDKQRPAFAEIAQVPGSSSGQLVIESYADFGASPMPYEYDGVSERPDGVSYRATSAVVDLDGGSGDGWTPVPLPGNWRRSVSVRISGDRPQDTIRLLSLSLDESQAKPVKGE